LPRDWQETRGASARPTGQLQRRGKDVPPVASGTILEAEWRLAEGFGGVTPARGDPLLRSGAARKASQLGWNCQNQAPAITIRWLTYPKTTAEGMTQPRVEPAHEVHGIAMGNNQ